ncbi:hypothetical protein [Streptomyces sp. NPDC048111]|uniref:hypothetical protein n=1 Tax=Streptomyces sp. NPDC048111 TaxID=3365500 RepID=UPI003712C7DE
MPLDLAALHATDFGRPRPGTIDPRTCPACAMIVSLLYEAAATSSTDLLSSCAELGALHALLGHPWDHRPERRDFLARGPWG